MPKNQNQSDSGRDQADDAKSLESAPPTHPVQTTDLQAKADADTAAEKAEADKRSAEQAATAAEEQKKAAEQQAAEHDKLAKRLEKLEADAAENDRNYHDSKQEIARLRLQLSGRNVNQEPVVLKSTALDAEKSKAQLREIWPQDSERLGDVLRWPGPLAKTFLVTPLAESASSMAPAIVENCADEGDAKREYFKVSGGVPHKVSVKVEPFGETKARYERQQKQREESAMRGEDEFAEFREFQRQKRAQQQTAQTA